MNSSKNISNAVHVLYKTYENVNKLMEYCRTIASDAGYSCMNNKFLRWKSDNEYKGWLVSDFIMLFQKDSDELLNNQWHNGAVYVMEIQLAADDDENVEPMVYLSKFAYKNIKSWSEGCSVSSHWVFYYPLCGEGEFLFEDKTEYVISWPKDQKISDKYWGLEKTIHLGVELTSINVNNVKEKIFGNFDRLDEIQI